MPVINLCQVDAFAEQLFGGNPAGVVLDASGLSDKQMADIAREMSLSETAFVLPPTTDQADIRLRYFTKDGSEVDFCGHATVGALAELAGHQQYGLGQPGTCKVRVEINIDVLAMGVVCEAARTEVRFAAPSVTLEAYHLQSAAFAKAFGVPLNLIDPKATILVDTTLNYVYIPAASRQALIAQQFNFSLIREQFGKEGVVVFCWYTPSGPKAHADLYARGLAPNVGIDEDPFTGSMQAGLLHAATYNHYLPENQTTARTEQGDCVGRPGSARLERDATTGVVTVTASAVHVFSTTMEVL